MTSITTPLPQTSHPKRNVRAMLAPASARLQQARRRLRYVSEGINSDDRAPLCDLTLRPYPEARSAR